MPKTVERDEVPAALGNGAAPAEEVEPIEIDFGDFLSAEREPQRVAFRMAGQDCWIDLLPMDGGDEERFRVLGVKLAQAADGSVMAQGEIDLSARNLFLVSRTVYDFLLWRTQRAKDGGEPTWYQVRPPAGDKQKPAFRNLMEQQVRDVFRRDRKFWRWLVGECTRVNGFDEETGGKLIALLSILEREAYKQFRWPEQGHKFSIALFGQVAAQWVDWENGIPPGRDWRGRGAQNPWLLLAFHMLRRARGRAQQDDYSEREAASRGPGEFRMMG